ncbi:methyltransferase domain-containing protein [Paucibacter sp. AS339]|uniref:class I SAM-dependent methyltransferase n=1 Tax=Paucibacter hankyongi TaxID=3133434 RepID=UPI0030B51FCD
MSSTSLPSKWLLRWAQATRPGATALDLACGSGRHVRHLAGLGMQVTGVDIDAAATAGLESMAEIITADIENGPWPLGERQFDLVLVTNYLWRPLIPRIKAAVAPGGWLIYETFAQGQQSIGRPARPEFLLKTGELLDACAGLSIVAFEDGFEAMAVNPRFVQRVAAVRDLPDGDFQRYTLDQAESPLA